MDEQSQTFGSRFETLRRNLDRAAEVSTDPAEVMPDRVLVLETLISIKAFADAARSLGFEWLAELAGDDDDEPMSRVYLTLPSEASLRSMLAFWRRFEAKEPRPNKKLGEEGGVWWDLFGYLKAIRVWSAEDRVDPSVADYVARFDTVGPQMVPMEVNLWFSRNRVRRQAAEAQVRATVESSGGDVLDRAVIEEIEYHALLVRLPYEAADRIVKQRGPIATAQSIHHIRPQSIARKPVPQHGVMAEQSADQIPIPSGEILGAMLDGYPIASHVHLKDRIRIMDVDVTGDMVPIVQRFHGTAMASLVVHGDLNDPFRAPLSSPLQVVPVLAPNGSGTETTPADKLPLPLIQRAVEALVAGIDGQPAAAPSVVVINHSLCDAEAPFVRKASSWARLLDHLAHKYRLLFVVSAGNIESVVRLDGHDTADEFNEIDELERRAKVLVGLRGSMGNRGLLSPAEAVNVLTVGAVHEDLSGPFPVGHFDAFGDLRMTNFCSAVGPGIRSGVKPDVVDAGGRQIVSTAHDDDGAFAYVQDTGIVGQLTAVPDPYSGSLKAVSRLSGTSNAAALTTRSAIRLAELLSESYAASKLDWNARGGRAAILRALAIHGASWGNTGQVLDDAFPPSGTYDHVRRRKGISGFLGFGFSDHSRTLSEAGTRATLVADDEISPGELHEYRIPVPASMLRTRELRRLIVTLAWNTPVRSTASYREIALDLVDQSGGRTYWKSLKNALQPNADSMRRGTVIHCVLEGSTLPRQAESNELFIGVQAVALHDDGAVEPAHYGLAVSLELASSVRSVDLRQELEVAFAARAAARSRSRTRA